MIILVIITGGNPHEWNGEWELNENIDFFILFVVIVRFSFFMPFFTFSVSCSHFGSRIRSNLRYVILYQPTLEP